MKRDHVLEIVAQHQAELKAMGVKSLALFGSVARDEAKPDSDVDFLVEFDDGQNDLFGFSRVRLYLQDILGCSVDMGSQGDLRTELRDRVLRDKINAF